MKEPNIIINGYILSEAEVMTVRVALETFSIDLSEGSMGTDSHGLKMADRYQTNIGTIRTKMFGNRS